MSAFRKFDPLAFLAQRQTECEPAKVAKPAKVHGSGSNFSDFSRFSSVTLASGDVREQPAACPSNVVPLLVRARLAATLDPDDYEHRAAVLQYDGGLTRDEAERQAATECGLTSS